MKCIICQDRGSIPSMDGPWSERCDCQDNENNMLQREIDRRYKVVCYMRIEPDDIEEMTLENATSEAEQARLMQPENIYRVEGVGDNDVVS